MTQRAGPPEISGGPSASEKHRVRTSEELFSRVRLQTAFRLITAVLLIGATAVVEWRGGLALALQYDFRPLYAVIGFVFATSLPALVALRGGTIVQVRSLERLAYAQFLVDVGVVTAIVYLTGGADSLFTFLYVLTIINASVVLFRRGALATAAAAALAYGLLVDLSFYEVLKPFAPVLVGGDHLTTQEALYKVSVHVLAFLLTAVLASYWAEIVRRTGEELEEKSIDLRELQALTKNIVENISSGLLTIDRSGRITSFNRSAEEITGKRLAEVWGQPLATLFPAVADRIGRHVESRRYEEAFVRADGVSATLGFSYSPLRDDDDEEIGTIVIFQDLTELREMETRLKREERLAAVGRLAAGIAHEIRNPLASISGSIEMLQQGEKVPPEDKRLMDIILRETDRLDGLITEFLDYVKPVKSRPSEPVTLEELSRETAEALAATDAGRGVEVVVPSEAAGTVRGDRDQLKQVLWNLFLNASQAQARRLVVRTTASTLGSKGDVVLFEIADDGVGIPSEELPRIFEPFYTTKERGTGLGLAMVHKIVEAHGGHIEVESTPGKGTTFRLVLPRWTEQDAKRLAANPLSGDRPSATLRRVEGV